MSFNLPDHSPLRRKDFLFGVATASFQVEGATEEDGRGESIWDRFCATPGKVLNGDNGMPACDHYHRWPADLDLIKELGFDAYRFSIAWPRIEPEPGVWNPAGFDFYDRLVDGMLERGLQPYATLYHWDLPQYLGERGGWVNRDTAYRFADYADKVTERLGDRVLGYATLNEPWCSAFLSYRLGIHAPGLKDDRLGFQAAHHLLLGHGLALPAMRRNAPKAQHGIVLNFTPAYPATDSADDRLAADYSDEENSHFYLQPLLTGEYPEAVRQRHPELMPTVYPGDMDILKRDIDFLGVNFYTRAVVKAGEGQDYEAVPQQAEETHIGWEIYPEALTELITGFKDRYANLPPIYITENGAADNTEVEQGEVNDSLRVAYYDRHLQAVQHAIEQGVDVRGYFAWSLMDNFEWAEGYSQRFGIVHVDYETQQRTPKASARAFSDWLSDRSGM
ncbi:GH1 family beta-glucosidase [Saccharospirillum salsuginis]|uniref:Beta-glucosidase n=1 Tax=Saccharospirillum salsuginis TaxID=418750 RepID=A0A918KQP3_9GAMM|nr:GH1 family beta-glucosidase [Saccharospirillum salsuginis]GGX73115.1 beta-glucosidase [Saccharospirillum salsuginis]